MWSKKPSANYNKAFRFDALVIEARRSGRSGIIFNITDQSTSRTLQLGGDLAPVRDIDAAHPITFLTDGKGRLGATWSTGERPSGMESVTIARNCAAIFDCVPVLWDGGTFAKLEPLSVDLQRASTRGGFGR